MITSTPCPSEGGRLSSSQRLILAFAPPAGGFVEGDQQTYHDWIGAMSPEQWPRVLLGIGDRDLMMVETDRMTEVLDEWGIPYTLKVEPGDHSYAYWSSNMEMYLLWYAEDW